MLIVISFVVNMAVLVWIAILVASDAVVGGADFLVFADVNRVVTGEALVVCKVVVGQSVVLSIAVVADAVAAEALVCDSTVVAVRVLVVWEVVVRESVVPKLAVIGDAVVVPTVMLVVSTLLEGGAKLVWKAVIGEPVESVTVVGDVVDAAVLVDVAKKVSGVAVLPLVVVERESFVLFTLVVVDAFVAAALVTDSEVVTCRLLVAWKVVVGASEVLGTVVVGDAVDVAVLVVSTLVVGD